MGWQKKVKAMPLETGDRLHHGGVVYVSGLPLFNLLSYFFQFLRSLLRRPHTDRIPEGLKKMFRRNRNRDSCGKSATGKENTGIWRIPTGKGNLAIANGHLCHANEK